MNRVLFYHSNTSSKVTGDYQKVLQRLWNVNATKIFRTKLINTSDPFFPAQHTHLQLPRACSINKHRVGFVADPAEVVDESGPSR